jgi:hypothetical protein
VHAAPLYHVVEYMLQQIDIEYASADQSLPNDPETNGRMFPEEEFDTWELLENQIELDLPNDEGNLMADIAATLALATGLRERAMGSCFQLQMRKVLDDAVSRQAQL